MKVSVKSLICFGLVALCSFASDGPADAPEMIRPLVIGAKAPDATMSTADGKEVSLKHYYGAKPTVLIFYRGSWCPYCQKQLSELQSALGDLSDEATFLIVSQDSVEQNRAVMSKNKLEFPVLSDPDLEAANRLGIVFKVDAETQKLYLSYGINLNELYGREQPLMPTPAVFVIRDGKISFSYANTDYTKRLSPDVIRAVLKAGN